MLTHQALEGVIDVDGNERTKDDLKDFYDPRDANKARALSIYHGELNRPASRDLGLHGTSRAALRTVCKSVVIQASTIHKRRYAQSQSNVSSAVLEAQAEKNAISALRMLQKERLVVSRLGFPDRAFELDREIEVMMEKAKLARHQQEEEMLQYRMRGLALSQKRKTQRFEELLADEMRKMEERFRAEEAKFQARQDAEFMRVLESATRRAVGRVKKCNCTQEYLCRHNKTASYNTRRPSHIVVQYRRNAKRLKHAGRPDEACAWAAKAAALDEQEQEKWRVRVANSIVASPWGANEAAVDQITELHKRELAVLRKTHAVKRDMLVKRQAMRRKMFQNTLLAEQRKVRMQCRKQALLKIMKDFARENREDVHAKQVGYRSDGLLHVSRNLLGDQQPGEGSGERTGAAVTSAKAVDWVPPSAFGLENSVRLIDAAAEIGLVDEKQGGRILTSIRDIKELSPDQIRDKIRQNMRGADADSAQDSETSEGVIDSGDDDDNEDPGDCNAEGSGRLSPGKGQDYVLGQTSGSKLVDRMRRMNISKPAVGASSAPSAGAAVAAAGRREGSSYAASAPTASASPAMYSGGWPSTASSVLFGAPNGTTTALEPGMFGSSANFGNTVRTSSSAVSPGAFSPAQPWFGAPQSQNPFVPIPSLSWPSATAAIWVTHTSPASTAAIAGQQPQPSPPAQPSPSAPSYRAGLHLRRQDSPVLAAAGTVTSTSESSKLRTAESGKSAAPSQQSTSAPAPAPAPAPATTVRSKLSEGDSAPSAYQIRQFYARPADWIFDPLTDTRPPAFIPGSVRDEDWAEHDAALAESGGYENSYGVSLVIPDPAVAPIFSTAGSPINSSEEGSGKQPPGFARKGRSYSAPALTPTPTQAPAPAQASSVSTLAAATSSPASNEFRSGHAPPVRGSPAFMPEHGILHAPVKGAQRKQPQHQRTGRKVSFGGSTVCVFECLEEESGKISTTGSGKVVGLNNKGKDLFPTLSVAGEGSNVDAQLDGNAVINQNNDKVVVSSLLLAPTHQAITLPPPHTSWNHALQFPDHTPASPWQFFANGKAMTNFAYQHGRMELQTVKELQRRDELPHHAARTEVEGADGINAVEAADRIEKASAMAIISSFASTGSAFGSSGTPFNTVMSAPVTNPVPIPHTLEPWPCSAPSANASSLQPASLQQCSERSGGGGGGAHRQGSVGSGQVVSLWQPELCGLSGAVNAAILQTTHGELMNESNKMGGNLSDRPLWEDNYGLSNGTTKFSPGAVQVDSDTGSFGVASSGGEGSAESAGSPQSTPPHRHFHIEPAYSLGDGCGKGSAKSHGSLALGELENASVGGTPNLSPGLSPASDTKGIHDASSSAVHLLGPVMNTTSSLQLEQADATTASTRLFSTATGSRISDEPGAGAANVAMHVQSAVTAAANIASGSGRFGNSITPASPRKSSMDVSAKFRSIPLAKATASISPRTLSSKASAAPAVYIDLSIEQSDARSFSAADSNESKGGFNWETCFSQLAHLSNLSTTLYAVLLDDDLFGAAEMYVSGLQYDADKQSSGGSARDTAEAGAATDADRPAPAQLMQHLQLLRGWRLYQQDPTNCEDLSIGLEDTFGVSLQDTSRNLSEVVQAHTSQLDRIAQQVQVQFVPGFVLSDDYRAHIESHAELRSHSRKLRIDSKSWLGKFQQAVADLPVPLHLFPFKLGRPYANKKMRELFGPMCDAPTPREYIDTSTPPDGFYGVLCAMKEGSAAAVQVMCRGLGARNKGPCIVHTVPLRSHKDPTVVKYMLVILGLLGEDEQTNERTRAVCQTMATCFAADPDHE